MARRLAELGNPDSGVRCRDASGRYVPCDDVDFGSMGCSLGGDDMYGYGLGADKMVPFDIPGLPESADLNLTDAIVGAVGGQVALGLVEAVVESKWGVDKANMLKVGVGLASLGGLFLSERLQENSLFLGFALASMPKTLKPATDWVVEKVLGLTSKLTGGALLGQNSGVYRPGSEWSRRIGVSQNVFRRRVGASSPTSGMTQGGTAIMPNIRTPYQMITAGRNVRTMQGAGAVGGPTVGVNLTRKKMFAA